MHGNWYLFLLKVKLKIRSGENLQCISMYIEKEENNKRHSMFSMHPPSYVVTHALGNSGYQQTR
jgi:hypothetical protein